LRRVLLCSLLLLIAAPAHATEYGDLGLHGRVQASDVVVVARVVDPTLALVSVEWALKGDVPKQFTWSPTSMVLRFQRSENSSWQTLAS